MIDRKETGRREAKARLGKVLCGLVCGAFLLSATPVALAAGPMSARETVKPQGQNVRIADGETIVIVGEKKAPESAAGRTADATPARGEAGSLRDSRTETAQAQDHTWSMRVTWPAVPDAVKYQVVVLRSQEDTPKNIALTVNDVFTTGVDIPLRQFGSEVAGFYWKVCPLDYYGHAIAPFSQLQPLAETGERNVDAPLPTTQFDSMAYSPEYPVYSWVPVAGVKNHIVEVRRESDGQVVRTVHGGEYDAYETQPFVTKGTYTWRVRGVTPAGEALTDWSEPSMFTVTAPTPFAALGDSITHGGGVMSVPPGYTMYDWETYSSVPVKNLGVSGNTTQEMLDRFERDVLPFSPRVLVIMGGVNDYRATTFGAQTVDTLLAIRAKCEAYGIIPVFVTPTPINPSLMHRAGIEQPPYDWQVHQQYINHWILGQKYCVDINGPLTDSAGNLRSDYTTDGLHPDYEGKKYIGETIGHYLATHFAWLTQN